MLNAMDKVVNFMGVKYKLSDYPTEESRADLPQTVKNAFGDIVQEEEIVDVPKKKTSKK